MECNQLVFYILTGCTHNCRLCVSGVPYYRMLKRNYTAPLEAVQFEMDEAFQLFTSVERITITGGEPTLHPQLADILSYIMRYAGQFGECRIFTNGSLMPNYESICVSRESKGKISFVVDDYGPELSPYAEELHSVTGCRINRYYGDAQYCDGWVDYGPLDQCRDYSYEQAQSVISHCHFTDWRMYNIFRGKLFYCTRAAIREDLGFFCLDPQDYLDLHDASLTLEEKRAKIKYLGTVPTRACYYCAGFDTSNSQRYPAAEQVKEGSL